MLALTGSRQPAGQWPFRCERPVKQRSWSASYISSYHRLPQVDVAVVGGGPVGLSTAHMCAKEGKTVAILEKYVLYNASGSSADFMRMFRTMYTEDYMVSKSDPVALNLNVTLTLILTLTLSAFLPHPIL